MTTPRKVQRKTTAQNAIDDINTWHDNQPAVIITDPDGIFPSGDEHLNLREFDEIPPKIPSPLASKVRGLRQRVKDNINKPALGRKPTKPRVSVENVISWGWGFLAQITEKPSPVVSRVFAVQAPVAGMILEDHIKNTVVDKLLQPLARAGSGGKVALALIGPPLIMGYMEKQAKTIAKSPNDEKTQADAQRKISMAMPILKQSLRFWIDIAGPKLDELMKQEERFQAEYGAKIDEMIEFFMTGIMPDDDRNI